MCEVISWHNRKHEVVFPVFQRHDDAFGTFWIVCFYQSYLIQVYK